MKSVLTGIYCLFSTICLISGCQRAPRVSPAAQPEAALAVAPMGSPTNNSLLKKKRSLLIQLLDGTAEFAATQGPEAQNLLQELSINVEQLPLKGVYRQFALANFYFQERRFIDGAQYLSVILDENPIYPYARNLLARSFYFLGNVDRAILELEYILINQSHDAAEFTDALFLAGMITEESLTVNRLKLQKGIKFLETYLRAAENSPHREKAAESLVKLRERLKKVPATTKI